LGHWLKQALRGLDIGFLVDGQVVGLRPVKVHSGDYARQEYGVTEAEAAAAAERIGKEIRVARRQGKVRRFTGSADELRD
jgi:hypothetical protein